MNVGQALVRNFGFMESFLTELHIVAICEELLELFDVHAQRNACFKCVFPGQGVECCLAANN
jgi:hypothetical protein